MVDDWIAEAKRDAEREFAKKQWHQVLIHAWKKFPDCKMEWAFGRLTGRDDVTPDAVDNLANRPKEHHEYRMTVRRFVASYLPATNAALWDGKSEDRVLAILNKEVRQVVATDDKKVKHESKMRRKEKLEWMATRASQAAAKDHYGLCSELSAGKRIKTKTGAPR